MRNEMFVAALLALAPLPAFAHVTLVERTALPGADYVAHFRVGHGCDGSPTIALTVGVPVDVSDVRPQAQAGWTIATVRSGARISAVTWKGRPDCGRQAGRIPGGDEVARKLRDAGISSDTDLRKRH